MHQIETVWRDIRHAVRVLRKNPAFTAAAVATLTLGIATNTAVFSVVNTVLLRPVDVPDPDRLVFLMNVSPGGSGPAASPAKFQHWRRQADVLQDVSAFRDGSVNHTGGAVPEELVLLQVSADFFRLFGAPVAEGRTFTQDEDSPNGPRVAVIGRSLRARLYGQDPDVIGRTILLGGDPHTIVGVLGEFPLREFGPTPEVFTPFQIDPATTEQGHYFRVAGRLPPGVTIEQARARLDASAGDFRQRFPDALAEDTSFGVEPVRDVLVFNARTSLLILAGAVGFVLLIACANVANLLLARSSARSREIAVRAAIGGSRGRILRQLLTESLVLASAAGALGLALGVAGMRALLSINTAGLPRVGDAGALVGLDWRVALFAVGAALATGLAFGAIPALHGARVDLASSLREGGGRPGAGARHNRARSTLVVVEVALAIVLLVGSALLIRTAAAIGNVDPGFSTSNVLTMRTSLASPAFATSAGVTNLIRTGVERLRAVPAVDDATAACCVPLQGAYGLGFIVAGRPLEGAPAHGGAGWMTVSPGYFEVFRIGLRRGRTFTDRDDAGGPPVVIINEAMARRYWPDGDPLADRLILGRGMREFDSEPERQVVGIVADTRDGGLNADPQPQMFVPQAQLPDPANALNVRLTPMAWFVRLRAAPTPAGALEVERALGEATGLPVTNRLAMDEIVSTSTSRQRFNMWLMSAFGASALLLAVIGVYGLMAYSVAQRRQEIGIRLALGARAADVRRRVVVEGLQLVAAGTVVGVLAAAALARLLASVVYGVATHDPAVFATVPVVLGLAAFAAVWIPAVRASRVDPITALRAD